MTTILGSSKAVSFVWLSIMVIIFCMGLFYIMLDQPIQKIKNMTIENATGTQYENPYKRVNTIWENFLMIFLFGIICFGVLTAMRRNNYG